MGFKQLICLSIKVQQYLKTMEIRNTSEFWQTRAQHTDSYTQMKQYLSEKLMKEGSVAVIVPTCLYLHTCPI